MPLSGTESFNTAQRRAVTHGDGPVLVIAGAGTGKTKTLAGRVAYLVENGVPPQRICLLTFTRRAAAELLRRAEVGASSTATGRVWGGTFHATANRLLRLHGRALGLEPNFTVIDQTDAADLMNLIRLDLGLSKTVNARRFPGKDTLAAIYSRMVNSRTQLDLVLETHFPWCRDDGDDIRKVFAQYTTRKRAQGVLDYDDLLLYWKALCDTEEAGRLVEDRFDHILVDEYQDTNKVQAEILFGMRRTRDNVMVVGDDAQAIYGFRGATVNNILEFPKQFKGTEIVRLEDNYRSTQPILDVSNRVMAHATRRFEKQLVTQRRGGERPTILTCLDEAEQSREVCDRVLAHREEGILLKGQAVLFRAGHNSDQLEVELSRRNIPFVKYGGLKFVEAAHVKDMIAALRMIENPSDELSWHRVLQVLEGIGPSTARRIMVAIGAGKVQDAKGPLSTSLDGHSPLQRLVESPPPVPPTAQDPFDALREVIADCIITPAPPVAAQIQRIRQFYEKVFTRLYDNTAARIRDLEQLEQLAGRYTSRADLITDLTLDPPSSTQDFAGEPLLDDDYLILSTIHSAKGCEWDAVHVLHVADGVIPSDMATGDEAQIDEERRLLYVAMTRARSHLHLYFPLRYYHAGRGATDRHTYAQLTRFIPTADGAAYERRSAPAVNAETNTETPTTADGTPVAVDAILRELW